MKTILLTQGKVALVDDADYESLNQYKWHILRRGKKQGNRLHYAGRDVRTQYGEGEYILMHRLILGLKRGDNRECDHIDGNGLNNQQTNLRICTVAQNSQSQRKRKAGTSRYKGVCWHRNRNKWQSYIRVNKELIHLGYYQTAEVAARTYDAAAKEHFGSFVLTNRMLGLL